MPDKVYLSIITTNDAIVHNSHGLQNSFTPHENMFRWRISILGTQGEDVIHKVTMAGSISLVRIVLIELCHRTVGQTAYWHKCYESRRTYFL